MRPANHPLHYNLRQETKDDGEYVPDLQTSNMDMLQDTITLKLPSFDFMDCLGYTFVCKSDEGNRRAKVIEKLEENKFLMSPGDERKKK